MDMVMIEYRMFSLLLRIFKLLIVNIVRKLVEGLYNFIGLLVILLYILVNKGENFRFRGWVLEFIKYVC